MKRLYIKGEKSTPEIDFNPSANCLSITGQSYPENAFQFYQPAFEWLEEYVKSLGEEVVHVKIFLGYLNTSSTKSILSVLDILEEAYLNQKDIRISWYYDEENELSYEIAEDFMDTLEIPFTLVKKEEY